MSKKKFAPKVWGFEPWFGAKNRRGADSPSLIISPNNVTLLRTELFIDVIVLTNSIERLIIRRGFIYNRQYEGVINPSSINT